MITNESRIDKQMSKINAEYLKLDKLLQKDLERMWLRFGFTPKQIKGIRAKFENIVLNIRRKNNGKRK